LELVHAKMYLRLLKGECAGYYNVLFKRKAAAPICIILCSITIACYILMGH
jgi:hypothetical protein